MRASRRRSQNSSAGWRVWGVRGDRGELAAHDLAQRLELAQAVFEVFGAQAAALAELLGGDRADDLHVSAGELDASVLAVGDANRRAGRQVELRLDRRFGEEQADRREVLSGETGCEVAARRGCCAPLRDQLVEQRSVDREHGEIEADEAEQQVVQLFGVADGRRGFLADALDRIDVELAEVALLLGQAAAGHHGAGATLFERGVVEEAERVDVEDALGHRRGRHRVARVQADLAGLDALQHLDQAVRIDGFVQTVVDRLGDQGMVGRDERAGEVLLATDLRGEDGREQIVGDHPLEVGGDFLAAAHAGDGEGAGRGPAPARVPERGVEDRLSHRRFGVARFEVVEGFFERERLRGAQREDDPLLVRGGLQLEIEAHAEALAQREAPGAVDARAEGRVDDELLPAGFVEEALEDDIGVGGHGSECVVSRAEVLEQLLGGGRADVAFALQIEAG